MYWRSAKEFRRNIIEGHEFIERLMEKMKYIGDISFSDINDIILSFSHKLKIRENNLRHIVNITDINLKLTMNEYRKMLSVLESVNFITPDIIFWYRYAYFDKYAAEWEPMKYLCVFVIPGDEEMFLSLVKIVFKESDYYNNIRDYKIRDTMSYAKKTGYGYLREHLYRYCLENL